MSEGHKHHFHHHQKPDAPVVEESYAQATSVYPTGDGGPPEVVQTEVFEETIPTEDGVTHKKVEVSHHKRDERLGEIGAAAAGAFALFEKHEAKKHPEQAHKHKIAEEVATAAAVGAGGYAFHEHHENKNEKKHHDDS